MDRKAQAEQLVAYGISYAKSIGLDANDPEDIVLKGSYSVPIGIDPLHSENAKRIETERLDSIKRDEHMTDVYIWCELDSEGYYQIMIGRG
jgi:hypothetical protein